MKFHSKLCCHDCLFYYFLIYNWALIVPAKNSTLNIWVIFYFGTFPHRYWIFLIITEQKKTITNSMFCETNVRTFFKKQNNNIKSSLFLLKAKSFWMFFNPAQAKVSRVPSVQVQSLKRKKNWRATQNRLG